MTNNESGKFVNGAWIESDIPSRLKQHIELKHRLQPYEASVKLNGQLLKCKSIKFEQSVRKFGTITLELTAFDCDIDSTDGVLFIEFEGMKFKRVE